jgi:hypothetical protein
MQKNINTRNVVPVRQVPVHHSSYNITGIYRYTKLQARPHKGTALRYRYPNWFRPETGFDLSDTGVALNLMKFVLENLLVTKFFKKGIPDP